MSRRVPRADAVTAGERINGRRYKHHDPNLARIPTDLLALVTYVHTYPAVAADPATEAGLRQADTTDAFLILDHLRGELDRQRRATFDFGRRIGMSWIVLAAAIGKRSRQHAEGEYQRLVAALADDIGVKDEKAARAARAEQRLREISAAGRAKRIRDLGAALVAAAGRIPDDLDTAYGLDELRYHLTHECLPGDVPPAGMVAGLRLLVAALQQIPLDVGLRATVDNGARLLDATVR